MLEEIAVDERDPEVKREVNTHATRPQTSQGLDCTKFGRFSSWASLTHAIVNLILLVRQFKKKNGESSRNETKP